MTEPTPEQLQKRMNEFGFTEQEARASLYLERAEELIEDLGREGLPESGAALLGRMIWRETHIREHFRALHRELAMRVLRRNYPEGWGYVPPENDD